MNSELKEKLKDILDNQLFGLYPKLASILQHGHVHKIIDCMAKSYNLDRTPSPSGVIKTAEQLAMDWANKEGYEHPSPYYSFIEGWKAHNQFAGDGWISVEDRLPEDGDDVLAFRGKILDMVIYNVPDNVKNPSECWFSFSDNIWIANKHITHWQPLPTPPQNTKES